MAQAVQVKRTCAKAMAEALQWHLLDSGAIYRVLALAALQSPCRSAFRRCVGAAGVRPIWTRVFVSTDGNRSYPEGEDVSGETAYAEVANAANPVAAFPRVREALPPTRIPRSARFNRRWTRYGDRGLPGCR